MLPLVLILLAIGSAGAMAYGTHADLAQYDFGVSVIMLSRRLQWPLVALALILCITLIALVISGKRRAWWLLGLAPVLALFAHRFTAGPSAAFAVYEDPVFVAASEASSFLNPDDYVVGLQFQDDWYAYPYATLFHYPVVAQADHDRRMLLMWSPFANRACAVRITRDLRGRDLDIVSMPARALLLYNRRIGQFVNGLTGRATDGSLPSGFQAPLPTTKTTWQMWRSAHPETRVLVAPGGGVAGGPTSPFLPSTKLPLTPSAVAPDTPVVLVATTQPVALLPDELNANPINLTAGDTPVFVFRDPGGVPRAFDRHVDVDLMPRFRTARGEGRKGAAFIDNYTETAWSVDGVALDGDLKGRRLTRVPIEEELLWGVLKYWYPELEMHHPATQPSR